MFTNLKCSLMSGLLWFTIISGFAYGSPFGIPTSSQTSQASLSVTEEDDHYFIQAVRGPFIYWETKVDKSSGAIYSFKEVNEDLSYDLLGDEGYNRKVSLLYFKGRGGAVFSKNQQITAHPIEFDIAADGSYFDIIYDEQSTSENNYFHNAYSSSLALGELLTKISVRITPPTEAGTAWSWQKIYRNVSDHSITNKVWANDLIFSGIHESIGVSPLSETSFSEGEWDDQNPTSYMAWELNSYLSEAIDPVKNVTVDLTNGLFENPVAGRSVRQFSWAGFNIMEWKTGFDYGGSLAAGESKVVEGSLRLDVKDLKASLQVTDVPEEDYYEVKAVRKDTTYWTLKVDKVSGGIYSFTDDDHAEVFDFLGNDGYFRNVTLISFEGRGGAVFKRRFQVEGREILFNIPEDGSYFEIIYDEAQTQSDDYFQNVYAHSTSPLNPGDLITKISLKIVPPSLNGTTWTWEREYENVSSHSITNKVWAKDISYLSLTGDLAVTRFDNTEKVNGGWDVAHPQSYMSYQVTDFSDVPLESARNFTFDVTDGILSSSQVNQTVVDHHWAGFYRLRWNSDFNYTGALAAGEVKRYSGSFYFDIDETMLAEPEPEDPGPTESPHYAEQTETLEANMVSLTSVADADWNETHVRKVLHTFALGSQVDDAKIQHWAALSPAESVRQMLSLNVFNNHFQPTLSSNTHSFGELSNLSATYAAELNSSGQTQESRYGIDGYRAPTYVWHRAILDSGLNPVRQRIGFFETSDHMSISLNSNATPRQIFKYYDDIMDALAQGLSYQLVLGIGAKSAAIATQYNHRENKFIDNNFYGNEDFAREFHQLFFGILGVDDPDNHEYETIQNTALALTDMQVERKYHPDNTSYLDDVVTFGTTEHHLSDLNILGQQIAGADANEKISNLANLAINHPESLANLPLKFIESMCDTELSETEQDALQQAWAANLDKNLLAFLRKYAASELFHNSSRFRFWSTMERGVIIQQRILTHPDEVTNLPSHADATKLMKYNNAAFLPYHDVFGPMTGAESVSNSDHFIAAFDNSTKFLYNYVKTDGSNDVKRDWRRLISPNSNGEYTVADVAEWLWQRFIADGLKNFGYLERAQVYALLAQGSDYQVSFDPSATGAYTSYNSSELEHNSMHQDHFQLLKSSLIQLDASDDYVRTIANQRIGLAIAFIAMTPYMFAQEGN